jgi:hypothetical protein
MNHNQLQRQILQMLKDASAAQVKRMERSRRLEPFLASLMSEHKQSQGGAWQAALNQHLQKPDLKKLNYQFFMIQREGLQQVNERINATIKFSQKS